MNLYLSRARRILLTAVASLLLPGCSGLEGVLGGEGNGSPIAPSSVATGGSGQSSADPNDVARLIALVTMEGLQVGGLSASSSFGPTILTLHPGGTSAGNHYNVQCNVGGEVIIGQLPPAIGQSSGPVGVVGVTEDWQDCAWDIDGAQITANGSLVLNGVYDPFATDQNIGVTGSFSTTPGESTAISGSVTGSGSFIGAIGNETVSVDGTGVTVLPADLTGGWHGTATFNDADGCTGIANLALTLTGSNSLLSGPLSYTVTGSSGSDPACSLSSPNGPIGSGDTIQISGTAQSGSVSFGGGGAAAHRNLQLQRYLDGRHVQRDCRWYPNLRVLADGQVIVRARVPGITARVKKRP